MAQSSICCDCYIILQSQLQKTEMQKTVNNGTTSTDSPLPRILPIWHQIEPSKQQFIHNDASGEGEMAEFSKKLHRPTGLFWRGEGGEIKFFSLKPLKVFLLRLFYIFN